MKSRTDASDTNKPCSRTPGGSTTRREAVGQACSKASDPETGSESCRGGSETGCAARARAVQTVQARMGGDCGPHAECDGNAVCLPVLPEIASLSGAGAWI